MLYPIATVSYPLTMTLGLPYDAPFTDSMQYYQYNANYIQLSISIPYSIPADYKLRIVLTSATFYIGTAYININSATYTPVYDYSKGTTILVISNMGPIVVGTTVKIIALIYINTNNLFRVSAYIDTNSVIDTFAASSYLYQGLV